MNGVKFFNKDDPLLYKLRDLGRLLIIVAAIVGYVLVKPINAEFKTVKEKIIVHDADIKENHESIAELESCVDSEIARSKTQDEGILDKLDDMSSDIQIIMEHILKK